MKSIGASLMIVGIAGVAAQGQVVTVFQCGFEAADGYSTGNLNGQNGWLALLDLNPNFARVTSATPLSGSQSLLLDGRQVGLSQRLGNRAAVGKSNPIAPDLDGVPLRYIEITGRCAIVDPTLSISHTSWGALNLNAAPGGELVTSLGPLSENGGHTFGWFFPDVVPVQPGVTFEFRHIVDYHTGFATEWMNDQLVYENFEAAFNRGFIPSSMYFDMEARGQLPFDTQVWFDDIQVTATYVRACPADFNADGQLDFFDYLDFAAAFDAEDEPADFNGDQQVDFFDYLDFAAAFDAGCD